MKEVTQKHVNTMHKKNAEAKANYEGHPDYAKYTVYVPVEKVEEFNKQTGIWWAENNSCEVFREVDANTLDQIRAETAEQMRKELAEYEEYLKSSKGN